MAAASPSGPMATSTSGSVTAAGCTGCPTSTSRRQAGHRHIEEIPEDPFKIPARFYAYDRYAQDLRLLYGKILRIDVAQGHPGYAIPPTNPFQGSEIGRDEIYAWGFRNSASRSTAPATVICSSAASRNRSGKRSTSCRDPGTLVGRSVKAPTAMTERAPSISPTNAPVKARWASLSKSRSSSTPTGR